MTLKIKNTPPNLIQSGHNNEFISRYKLLFIFSVLLLPMVNYAAIWPVGPNKTYKYCSQVASLVQQGDTITIDAALYVNDAQVQWTKNNLFIVGIGGRPRLQAGSVIANDNVNGKGIFVVKGSNIRVENIEFANAKVVDHNGAGIRQEGANLYVSHCKFDGNEMGILQGGTIQNCTTTIEYSEFLNGGSATNPGYQHNIYINFIDTLIFRYNHSYDATAEGHELKSRAKYNIITYNTIANQQTTDSRTIDLPNGGTVIMLGNIIEQGPNSANSNILGYGLEGLTNLAPHELWIANNTFVNKKNTGSFIHLANGTKSLFLKNNIMVGRKTAGLIIGSPMTIDSSHNIINDDITKVGFVNPNNYDYHLASSSIAIDGGLNIALSIFGYSLLVDKEYKYLCDFQTRYFEGQVDIGAFEFQKTLSTENHQINLNFSIYPNPCMGWISIKTKDKSEKINLQIINLNGKILLEKEMQDNEILDLSAFPHGLYIIRTKEDQGKILKLIKTE